MIRRYPPRGPVRGVDDPLLAEAGASRPSNGRCRAATRTIYDHLWSWESLVRTVQLRDAKARLSALVEAAEKGEASVITKHGRPAAMLVPMDMAERLIAAEGPSLAEMLLSIPAGFEVERDPTPLRAADL